MEILLGNYRCYTQNLLEDVCLVITKLANTIAYEDNLYKEDGLLDQVDLPYFPCCSSQYDSFMAKITIHTTIGFAL